MSRIGKRLISLPKGVEVKAVSGEIHVKGPKGQLKRRIPPKSVVTIDAGGVSVAASADAGRDASKMQGLTRALINNMVQGVSKGWTKTLELVGVGYRADVQGSKLVLNLGYSHPIEYPLPQGISAKVEEKQTRIILEGVDNELLGETAAIVRRFRPPEPYKGKGVRYQGEQVRHKAGKAGKAGAGAK
jgi:large subunit ribosomal protein L6